MNNYLSVNCFSLIFLIQAECDIVAESINEHFTKKWQQVNSHLLPAIS